MLGGAHLTSYSFLPYSILRVLSSTECGKFDKSVVGKLFTGPLKQGNGSLNYMEKLFQKRVKNTKLRLMKDIKDDLSKIVKVPWFYACNQDRYPSWQGKHDLRVT